MVISHMAKHIKRRFERERESYFPTLARFPGWNECLRCSLFAVFASNDSIARVYSLSDIGNMEKETISNRSLLFFVSIQGRRFPNGRMFYRATTLSLLIGPPMPNGMSGWAMPEYDQTTSNMRFTHYTGNNNAANFVLLFALRHLCTVTLPKWQRATDDIAFYCCTWQ